MPPTIPFGNAVLCDYVGKGEANKSVLVNVYSGDVILTTMPAFLQLGFYVELLPRKNREAGTEVHLKLNGKSVFDVHMEGAHGTDVAVCALQSFPLQIEEEGIFEIIGEAKGYETTVFLRKKIINGQTSPIVSLQPSTQSLTSRKRTKKLL